MGTVATSTLPPGGSPPLQSGGQNQMWPTRGQGGYITPAALGVPTASEREAESELGHKWARWLHKPCRLGVPTASEQGAESEVAHKWARWLHNPCHLGGPHHFRAGAESEVAHKWGRWLHKPCRLGGPHGCRAGGRIRCGPQVGKVATQPLPPEGSLPLHSVGQNQIWPTSEQGGYITPAACGVPTASEQGAESEVVHKWARWLHNPCRLGGPHHFRVGGRIRSGPQVGKVAT